MTNPIPSGHTFARTGGQRVKLSPAAHALAWVVMRGLGDALGRDALRVANALEVQCAATDGMKTRPHEVVFAETSGLGTPLTNKSLEFTSVAASKTVAVSTNAAAGRGEKYVEGSFKLTVGQTDASSTDADPLLSLTFSGWEQEDKTIFLARGKQVIDLRAELPEWSGVYGAGTMVFQAIGLAVGDKFTVGFEGRAAGLMTEEDFAVNREFFAGAASGSVNVGGAWSELASKVSARVQKDVASGLGAVADKLGIGNGSGKRGGGSSPGVRPSKKLG